MDLIVRDVRLANGFPSEPADIGVAGGKIVAIERGLAATARTYDAAGASPAPVWSKRTSILDSPASSTAVHLRERPRDPRYDNGHDGQS